MGFEDNGWFNLNEINDGVWAISDITSVNCYLIEGKTKSLLIDTGWGLGNLQIMLMEHINFQIFT